MKLGNLEAVRDWGHAKDYCGAYYKMMGSEWSEFLVYVVATG